MLKRYRERRKGLTATGCAQKQDLSVKVTDNEGGSVVSLDGRFNIDSSPGVREELLDILKRESLPTLTIDLSNLTYIDCSGIATLIEALRIAKKRGTKLQLRGLHDGPRQLLEVTGLLPLFDTDGVADRSSASKVS
jgi:anti-sigma B factor antagonist